MISVATIGFTQSSAEHFFERLIGAGVRTVVDVRLHNTSQLAGFAKADDLAWFLRKLGPIDYVHEPLLAPTNAMLKGYRKEKRGWDDYEAQFRALMHERHIEEYFNPERLDGSCLLCSEATPHRCHRRLICDYLNEAWNGVLTVRHL
ncbi:MAG TPA: DUF488 domain-containing protein [Acetobacteraceae bacterium]|jgi:uncharacterized protein (DUF488 family)|nr:DUF488 domain-containing protein [Acetobacteraceae bacterium]